MTPNDARKLALNYNYFGTLMIKSGDADGMVSGANHSTADTVRPALQIIKSAHKERSVSSALILVANDKPYIFRLRHYHQPQRTGTRRHGAGKLRNCIKVRH